MPDRDILKEGASPPKNAKALSGANGEGLQTQITSGPSNFMGAALTAQTRQRAALPSWHASLNEAAREIAKVHGQEPATLRHAAAHEAGHVLIGHVLGLRVLKATLWKLAVDGETLWGGTTEYETLAVPAVPLHRVACLLAGSAGERTAGLYHAASSLDELSMAWAICTHCVAEGETPEPLFARVGAFCLDVIARRRLTFDVVRAQLERSRRLTRVDAFRLLKAVGREELH